MDDVVTSGSVPPTDAGKWRIEKCRLGRSIWHVYGPVPPHDPDEWAIGYDGEFHTGEAAIAFVAARLRVSR